MAKKGMARPNGAKTQKNDLPPVPEIEGKAKHGKEKARVIIGGTSSPSLKVFHEKPISGVYSAIDTDLARDNLENDIPAADLEDI